MCFRKCLIFALESWIRCHHSALLPICGHSWYCNEEMLQPIKHFSHRPPCKISVNTRPPGRHFVYTLDASHRENRECSECYRGNVCDLWELKTTSLPQHTQCFVLWLMLTWATCYLHLALSDVFVFNLLLCQDIINHYLCSALLLQLRHEAEAGIANSKGLK